MNGNSSAEATATVIVARTAQVGKEELAREWVDQLAARARRADGHLRSEIQAPSPQHPDEWVVVYEFVNASALNAWLASTERADFAATELDIFVGDAHEQRLATANSADSVTAVSSFVLRPGTDDAFALHYDELLDALPHFDGFIRCELFAAQPDVQDDTIIVFAFRTRAHLDVWLESETRQSILERIDPLLAEERTVNVVGGFAGWFTGGDTATVPTWKQATLVLAALYPTALALGLLKDWLLPDIGYAPGVLIGNVLGVAILSWVLMPYLTRRFARWLHADTQ